MDTLVLDLETKNTFGDVGATDRSSRAESLLKLEISVVCVYSYAKDKYQCFDETEFSELKKLLSERAVLVGFSSNKFDLPLLVRTLNINLSDYPRVDLSDEVEVKTGRLVSLDKLTKLNLGIGKTGHGLGAPDLYRAGKIEELKTYCQNDVKITKELYDFVKKHGYLLVPDLPRQGYGKAGKGGENFKKIDIKIPLEI